MFISIYLPTIRGEISIDFIFCYVGLVAVTKKYYVLFRSYETFQKVYFFAITSTLTFTNTNSII